MKLGDFGLGGFCPRGILCGGVLSGGGGVVRVCYCPGGFCPVTR